MPLTKGASGFLPYQWWGGHTKHQDHNVKQLEMKLKLVYHKKEALKEEIMKELVRGETPSREFRLWLDKGEKIEHQIKKILKAQTKDSVLNVSVSSEKLEHLMSMLEYEIAKYLEVSPLDQGPSSESSQKLMRLRIRNKMRGSINKLRRVKPKTKAEEKAEAKILVHDVVRHSKNKTSAEVEYKVANKEMVAESSASSGPSIQVAKEDSGSQAKGVTTAAEEEAKKADSEMKNKQTCSRNPNRDGELHLVSTAKHQAAAAEAESIGPSGTRKQAIEEDLSASATNMSAAASVPIQMTNERSFKPSLLSSPKAAENAQRLRDETQIASLENMIKLEERLKTKKSIKSMVQKIIQSKAKVIGLYGQGGSGKTAVVRALIEDPKVIQKFDLTIWVSVSRRWSMRKIQEEVLRQMPFYSVNSWPSYNIAASLFRALEKEKFLLILDDVWEKIDLNEVGIPFSTQGNGCKLIMTTRSVDICRDMAGKAMQVPSLSSEDSWELFSEQAGPSVDSPEIEPYARGIVNESGGLPLSIIVIGKALSGETDVAEWKLALKYFLLPKTGEHSVDPLMQHLTFCFERLNGRARKNPKLTGVDVRMCFLYCAHFPEGFVVKVSNLVEYWIQEGLISGNSEDSSQKGHDVVKTLIDAGLLESTRGGVCVEMNSNIRDLASGFISAMVGKSTVQGSNLLSSHGTTEECNSQEHLLRAGAGLTEPPPEKEWEVAKIISLEDNDLSSLPEMPNCPKLLQLTLQRNPRLRVLPVSFFNHMPVLKVLNMSKTRITTLPSSIQNLQNLEHLNLRDCERLTDLPPELGKLKQLESLDLHGTVLNKLPEAVGELQSLKDLEVSFYGPLDPREYSKLPSDLIPPGSLLKLNHLNNLSIDVKPGDQRWGNIAESIIIEMHGLNNLTSLKFYFPELQHLSLFLRQNNSWRNKSLKKFIFIVGFDNKRMLSRVPHDVELDYIQHDRCLRLVNEKSQPQEAIKQVLSHTTSFYLDHHLNIRSLSQFGAKNILGLEFCVVRECPAIEYIVKGKELALPFLEYLSLHYLEELKGIWNAKGRLQYGSFASLKCLSVHTCQKLEFVFTDNMSQCVPNLEELIVGDCQAIQNVIFVKNPVNFERPLLPKMRKLRLSYLPNLISIWRGTMWPLLENVSFYFCPKVKNLNIGSGSRLKESIMEIEAEKKWWDLLDWDDMALYSSFVHMNVCKWI